MTDKEQIIIDGIDVSECRYSYREYLTNKIKCSLDGFFYCESLSLCEGKNCCFKQLARKTQECEELKEKLSAANLEIENLKKELDKAYEWEQTNRATGICETCTEKANLTLDIYRDGMNKILDVINKIKE